MRSYPDGILVRSIEPRGTCEDVGTTTQQDLKAGFIGIIAIPARSGFCG